MQQIVLMLEMVYFLKELIAHTNPDGEDEKFLLCISKINVRLALCNTIVVSHIWKIVCLCECVMPTFEYSFIV